MKNPCIISTSKDILPHNPKNSDTLFLSRIFNANTISAVANIAIEFVTKYCINCLGNHGVATTTKKQNNARFITSFLLTVSRFMMRIIIDTTVQMPSKTSRNS